ncbi:MAG: Dps family protein [Cypionkella sp.]
MTDRLKASRLEPLKTRSQFGNEAVKEISMALCGVLADVFALYLKTKNFHWHASGPHFRDYHLMFDDQAAQILAITDPIAERARKLGGLAIHSIGQISKLQTILDNDADYVDPQDMLAELRDDNGNLIERMRSLHALCDEYSDIATASLIETWIDEAEGRRWFLFEAARGQN